MGAGFELVELDLRERGLLEEVLRLRGASYRVEAELLGDDRIPPLHESAEELSERGFGWVGAFIDGHLVGAIAWTEVGQSVDIERLVVAPGSHRQGMGRALVERVLAGAGARRVVVSTGRASTPARHLYESLGFGFIADYEPVPGLWMSRYEATGPFAPATSTPAGVGGKLRGGHAGASLCDQ